jgi:hypothetical protein
MGEGEGISRGGLVKGGIAAVILGAVGFDIWRGDPRKKDLEKKDAQAKLTDTEKRAALAASKEQLQQITGVEIHSTTEQLSDEDKYGIAWLAKYLKVIGVAGNANRKLSIDVPEERMKFGKALKDSRFGKTPVSTLDDKNGFVNPLAGWQIWGLTAGQVFPFNLKLTISDTSKQEAYVAKVLLLKDEPDNGWGFAPISVNQGGVVETYIEQTPRPENFAPSQKLP